MITARNYAAQAEKGLIEYSNSLDNKFHLDKLLIRKIFWVNSCLVGSAKNGRIDKSYRIY